MSFSKFAKTYNIMNVGNKKMLNLFSLGKASNGMNVVLYEADGSDEQKWTYDDRRLFIETNPSYCLDRFNDTRYSQHDNADIWKESSKEDDNQEIEIIFDGHNFKIHLLKTNLYLTANSGSNGTGSGKTTTSRGNVYWALEKSSAYQLWDFDEVKSSGGDNTGSDEGKGNGKISEGHFPSTFNPKSSCYKKAENMRFKRGQCTWYCYGRALEVTGKKIKFNISSGIHGKYWYEHVTNCKQLDEPVANSIVVWDNRGPYGHVGYVEKVSGNDVYISEANWDLDVDNPNPKTDGKIKRFKKTSIKKRVTNTNGTYRLLGYLEL